MPGGRLKGIMIERSLTPRAEGPVGVAVSLVRDSRVIAEYAEIDNCTWRAP